ncbi:MAG: ComF family protein [Clostridium celatum]|nr:ComF family protein [Clostridium celatum]
MGKAIFEIMSKILILFKKTILRIYNEILDIVYPIEEKCIICRADGFIGLCSYCKSRINRATIESDNLSYGFYGGIVKTLILKFKYESDFTSGYLLSKLLVEMIEENKIYADVICYVPMTKKSEKKRGFNQCEVIARHIGYHINIPVSDCIKKIKNTKEQKTLTKEERVKNLKGAFKVIRVKDIKNKDVILIDDVMTTGATINECKDVLKKSGANKITVLTIAKSNI